MNETVTEKLNELHCSLFHVESTDTHDETGALLEEVILVQWLSEYPEMLKDKPLEMWVKEICGNN